MKVNTINILTIEEKKQRHHTLSHTFIPPQKKKLHSINQSYTKTYTLDKHEYTNKKKKIC